MANLSRILIIDDESSVRDSCGQALRQKGYLVESAPLARQGLELLARRAFDVILLDLRLPDLDGMETLRRIRRQDGEAQVIIITAHGTIGKAVEAMKLGACDFLTKPYGAQELRAAVHRALEQRRLRRENAYLRSELRRRQPQGQVIYRSPAMAQVLDLLAKVAPSDSTVLLSGESGTGKGLLARRLHELSPRRQKPFVAVDCSALVPTLFESELFGHVRGAFTGAESDKMGKFELSQGGTLFLDEVSNISLEIQAKLLAAVEERAICRVGSVREIQVDTRLVAASNRDLASAVVAGGFRADLFHRLNVVNIHLPPLRERREDIKPLAEFFLGELGGRSGARRFSPGALKELERLQWPGNVRELKNRVQRMVLMAGGPVIERSAVASSGGQDLASPLGDLLRLADVERAHIAKTLSRYGGHRSRTAEALGIDRKTLRSKIRKYGLEEPRPL